LGFLEKKGGRLSLTPSGEKYLETGDSLLALNALRERVLGFDEILEMLSKGQGFDLDEIHNELLDRCGVDWEKPHQAMYRLNWLISLGFVVKKGRKYFLTREGLKVCQGQAVAVHKPVLIENSLIKGKIQHVMTQIEKYPRMSESNTISALVEPVLEILGWNLRDLDEVQREYPIRIGNKVDRVDLALKINNRPVLFVEVKSLDIPLEDRLAEQPIKYAIAEGVSWCILTNGREWRLYNAFWRIKGIDKKMFFKISVDEFDTRFQELMLLSKESLKSGELEEEGELEYARRMALEWLKQEENSIIESIMKLDPGLKEKYVRRALRSISSP
jgi:hypothetical protein